MSSEDGEDGGYVHDPATFEGNVADAEDASGEAASVGTAGSREPGEGEFGTGGWLLVALLVVCLLVIPVVILFRPPELPWEVAFLVLPLLPGFLLGGAAVWTALRSR